MRSSSRAGPVRLLLGCLGVAALPHFACRAFSPGSAASATSPAAGPARPSVKVYSEPLPVTAIAFRSPYLWAGSARGLVRWNVASDEMQRMGREQGLPGVRVSALAFDASGGLWVVTEAGLGRIAGGKYVGMPPLAAPGTVTAVAPLPGGDGAWIAGAAGLQRTDGRGWTEIPALRGVAITSLETAGDGALWVGTRGRGLLRVGAGSVTASYGPADGVDLHDVVGMAALDSGIQIAAGRGGDGARLLQVHGGTADLLTAVPEVPLHRIARVGGEIVILAGEGRSQRLYKLRPTQRGEPVPEGGFRLLPVRKAPSAPRYAAVPLALATPPAVTVIAAGEHGIWFGTEALGVLSAAEGGPAAFRSGELVTGAERITVACPPSAGAASVPCLVVTGGPQAWSYDGRTFAPAQIGPGQGARAAAVLTDHASSIYAVSRETGFAGFVVTRLEGSEWKAFRRIPALVPQGEPLYGWGAMAPNGNLWIGVRYKDKDGQERPYGAIEEDFIKQRTLHHRHYDDGETPPAAALPLSNDVTGLTFEGGALWFASRAGVIRWHESAVKSWGENEGLESELCAAVARGPSGQIWVATADGVGRFDGQTWRFADAGPMRIRARALAQDARGRMWVATHKGLVMAAGQDIITYDAGNGLLDAEVRDVSVDARGRVWALGPSSIAVLE